MKSIPKEKILGLVAKVSRIKIRDKDNFSGFLATLLATSCFTALPALAAEDAYPSRPVKFILAGQPGSGTDLQGCAVAAEMFKAIGQPVKVSPQLLDVPTSAEAGMPTFQFGTWSMVLLPAQTPE